METSLPALPDLHDVRAFCAVVDLGSVTAAARSLRETKGSVSRRLHRLERTLGIALVRRSPRLVQPTEEGVAYRARAGRILEALDDARRELEGAGAAPRGRLRVTAPPDLAVGFFAPLVARFVDAYPTVAVDMVITDRVLDFDAHQLDVALRPSAHLEDSSLIAHKLTELESRFVASPSYLAKHGAPRAPADLASHRLLLFGPQDRALPEILGERRGGRARATNGASPPLPAIYSTDGNFARAAALAGGGVACLPALLVERDVREGRLVALLEGHSVYPRITLYLLHPASRFVPAKVRAFKDFLVAFTGPCVEAKRRGGRPRSAAAATTGAGTRDARSSC